MGGPEKRTAGISAARRFTDLLRDNYTVVLMAVGYSLALFPFNWGLWAAAYQPEFAWLLDFNVLIDIGELIGFSIAIGHFLVSARKKSGHHIPYGAPFLLVLTGDLAIGFSTGGIFDIIGDVGMGCGYALVLVLWLDLMSYLPPRKMLIVLSSGFLFNLVSYPTITSVPKEIGCLYIALCATASLAFMAVSSTLTKPASNGSSDRSLRPYWPKGRLIAFVIVIPLAYGFCTNYLGIGVSSIGLKLGFALPALIVMVGLTIHYERFNIYTVYWITFPLMMIGLLTSFFLNLPPMLSKALIAGALGSMHIVFYIIVKIQSQEQGESPFISYALLSALVLVSTILGKQAHALLMESPALTSVTIILIMAVAVAYGLIIFGSNSPESIGLSRSSPDETDKDHALKLAEVHSLSKRETSVYLLMLDDRTINEMAEELFIAPSTVRAHVSRVYEKFDVHSRQEFFRKTR